MNSQIQKSNFFILFVDDEENSVKYFQKLLGREFNVIATTNPLEVLEIINEGSKEIAVVISDQKMPQVGGVDLLAKIKEKNPNIVRILTTAYANLEDNIAAINKGHIFAYLTKPWNLDEMHLTLISALEEYGLRRNYLSLSGSIAHEMRNPLNSVRQSARLAKEKLIMAHQNERFCGNEDFKTTPLTKESVLEIANLLDIADRSSQRGNMMIDIILDSLSEKPKKPDLQILKISKIIEIALSEYAFDPEEKNKVTINIKPENDFLFKIDENLFTYILFNLIKNSLYYLPSHPNLTISLRTEIGTDNFNYLYVYDTGPGIPKDKINFLFGNFATFGKKGGTGLGLAFCKRTMKDFGGDITCSSEVGGFTEFTLKFPKLVEEKVEDVEKKEATDQNSLHLLLVDDQKINLKINKKLIEENLHNVICDIAENGQEALELVKNKNYEVILMDIQMPVMDGIEASRAIKKYLKDNNLKPIPILSYSSTISKKEIKKIPDLHFDAHIEKPLSYLLLIKAVAKWGLIKYKSESKLNKSSLHTRQKNLKDKKILFVDDFDINHGLFASFLKKYDAKIDDAKNGLEAFEKIKSNNYDVVLMDINMPVMDGIQAAKLIRQYEEENGLKENLLIAITGEGTKGEITEILSAGFDDYFTKGNDYEDLFELMTFWLKSTNENNEDMKILDLGEIEKTELIMVGKIPEEIMRDFFPLFIDTADKSISKFKDATKNQNIDAIVFESHALKGIAGNIGAERIYKYSTYINDLTKNGKWPEESWVEKLETMLNITKEEFGRI